MTERNSKVPDTLSQDVVAQIGLQAQEQGTTVTDLLRRAYETQVGAMATKSAAESDSESTE